MNAILSVTIFILVVLSLSFIPSFVAITRKSVHVLFITLLNLFLGWTFIGWVAALLWASVDDVNEQVKTVAPKVLITSIYLIFLLIPAFMISLPYLRFNVPDQNIHIHKALKSFDYSFKYDSREGFRDSLKTTSNTSSQ